ncbi:MAG: hypothetical protein U0166_03600 [Acidobacteriota bacterium]
MAAPDLDDDGVDEIACGAGPGPQNGSPMRSFFFRSGSLTDVPFMSIDVYGLAYGLRVAAGDIGY